jgi:AIPR protein
MMSTVITADVLYDLVNCPHRVTMDAFGDPAERDPINAFVELLWKRGSAFEDEVIADLTGKLPFVNLRPFAGAEKEQNDLEAFQQKLARLSEKEDFDATINVIDNDELRRRHDYAIESDNPSINYTLKLAGIKYMYHEIAGTPVLIAALPLKECIKLPGIKDGTLFQKNVRQSLGSSNTVNKGIRSTIIGDKRTDFFFFHNGITALCNKMQLDGDTLTLRGLSVVNGCQSLNTILPCSETAKKLDDAFILFRFYEIPQRDRADKISIFTNSQSAVKARDLRSNDKRVLAIKKAFELKYPSGFFITKRRQTAPPEKNKDQVVELSNFAKNMIAWHSLLSKEI